MSETAENSTGNTSPSKVVSSPAISATSKSITGSTPKQDGFRMPGEYEEQKQVWMIWPERSDTYRNGAKPIQETFVNLASTIAEFEPVTMLVSNAQYENARTRLPENIRVVEMSNDDCWARDTGPTFVINDKGEIRACDWTFNAWGGLVDGLYFPWDKDDKIAQKICELEGVSRYRTDDFVLEGGSIHADGEGTLLTTEMCLLSKGRNPGMSKEQIEDKLKEYLNIEKIIWIKDGIDPQETNGHVDMVACFVRPGEVACIWTDDPNHPFYDVCQSAYKTLSGATDAKGRKLKVWKLTMTKNPVYQQGAETIDQSASTVPRKNGEICDASYMNFLIVNGGVIVPQYGDENDALALKQIQEMFPDRKVVGVNSTEIIYGGGNIHCVTQQQPAAVKK
ncbi:MAG: agmatine deiminase [Lachnospiraceae bacterium]|nr:agmatine deiminase [Lachnospiraceae bacterium]